MKAKIFRTLRLLSSDKLTITLLVLLIFLTVVGTIDQKNIGLYQATKKYFASAVFFLPMGKISVPFPGAYGVLMVFFVNLLAAMIVKFKWNLKTMGSCLCHGGVLLLLVGSFLTLRYSKEGYLALSPGDSAAEFTSDREYRLVVKHTASAADRSSIAMRAADEEEHVVAFPKKMLAAGRVLKRDSLPFRIEVREYYQNCRPMLADPQNPSSPVALQSLNAEAESERNIPGYLLSIAAGEKTLGEIPVSAHLPAQFSYENNIYTLELEKEKTRLPFAVTLTDARREFYPGTETPKLFESEIAVEEEGAAARKATISMNRPFRYRGYTFYQSGFGADRGKIVSTLSVVNNPGAKWPYFSCLMIALGMLLHFLQKLVRFLGQKSKAAAATVKNSLVLVLAVTLLAATPEAKAAPDKIPAVDWSQFRSLPIQQDGRVKPLDTFAGNLLLQFSGKKTVRTEAGKLAAVEWLAEVLFRREKAAGYPVFLIENPAILQDLGIPYTKERDRYSYNTLLPHIDRIGERAREASQIEDGKRSPLHNQTLRLYHNLGKFRDLTDSFAFLEPVTDLPPDSDLGLGESPSFLDCLVLLREGEARLHALFHEKTEDPAHLEKIDKEKKLVAATRHVTSHFTSGRASQIFTVFPARGDKTQWQSPWEILLLPLDTADPRSEILQGWVALHRAYRQGDLPAATGALDGLHRKTVELAQKRGEYRKILLEVKYNRYDLFFWGIWAYLLSMVLCAVSWIGRRGFKEKIPYYLSLLCLIAGIALQTYGIAMRMEIQGRPPVTNLYETILFAGWGCAIASLIVEWIFRNRLKSIGILAGSVLGAALSFVAERYATDGDTMGVLIAVLDSNFWLTTHVITITIGYSACLLAGLVGHLFVLAHLFSPGTAQKHEGELYRIVYGSLCFATLFSFVGTVLGGLWADQSWGRFWGWDPKENGALLIVLWNALLLHARPYIRDWGMALGAIFGNVIVVMAWWGVNLLNIGLHSYGFTSGLFLNLLIFTGVEIGFILVGLIAMYWHRPPALQYLKG